MEKKKAKTVKEIANGLIVSLNETEAVLNTFRNVWKKKFRKQIDLSDKELTKRMNEDTESFIRTRSEYETMYYFLERKGLLEEYAKFRASVHKEIQKRFKESPDEHTS